VTGLTFDTGALIALERGRQRMKGVVERALMNDQPITVPTGVIGEWWRGRTNVRDAIIASVDIEPLTTALAKVAGEALAVVRSATLVDAIVMASAASRGDIVYTGDVHDFEKLSRVFPGVRILGV
jgi:predicted nucleic acid-binding protein